MNNELRDIEIPLITATPSAVDENVTPVHFEKQTNISEEPSENNIMEEE